MDAATRDPKFGEQPVATVDVAGVAGVAGVPTETTSPV
jgi:hypothetical protein